MSMQFNKKASTVFETVLAFLLYPYMQPVPFYFRLLYGYFIFS